MKFRRKLFTAIACCLLTACASPTKPALSPPANLVAPCLPVPLLPPKATMGDLLAADVELAGLYRECARRHAGLAEWATGLQQ